MQRRSAGPFLGSIRLLLSQPLATNAVGMAPAAKMAEGCHKSRLGNGEGVTENDMNSIENNRNWLVFTAFCMGAAKDGVLVIIDWGSGGLDVACFRLTTEIGSRMAKLWAQENLGELGIHYENASSQMADN